MALNFLLQNEQKTPVEVFGCKSVELNIDIHIDRAHSEPLAKPLPSFSPQSEPSQSFHTPFLVSTLLLPWLPRRPSSMAFLDATRCRKNESLLQPRRYVGELQLVLDSAARLLI